MGLDMVFSIINTLSLEEFEALRRYVEMRHQELMISAEVEAIREGQLREGLSEQESKHAVESMKPLYRIDEWF